MNITQPTTRDEASTVTDLHNWISLSEAAARLPSPRTGKRTHSSTVFRLAKKHGLQMLKRGPYRFVFWPAVLEILQPDQPASPRPQREMGARRSLAQDRRTQESLRRHGVI